MSTREPLVDAYRSLASLDDGQSRGRQFEALVAELFRAAHFHVTVDPQAARPRQTDLVAVLAGDTYLIETQWEGSKSDVSHVDDLRVRLQETHAPVVGVLISVAGFSNRAIERVRSQRDRPIVLVTGPELELVLAGPRGLRALLRRKERDLVVDGAVRFDDAGRSATKPRPRGSLPSGRSTFLRADGKPWLVSGGGSFNGLLFVGELPDADWTPSTGRGVVLDLALPPEDEGGLLHVLTELAQRGWVTDGGRWSIQQAHTTWHGAGCREFADAVCGWAARYASATEPLHHTEQAMYFDTIEGLVYTLSVDLLAQQSRRVDYCNLSFQFTGVPVEPAPIRELAQAFGIDGAVYFRPMTEPAVQGHGILGSEAHDLAPLGFVVEEDRLSRGDGPPIVTGIIVENPFLGRDATSPTWWPAEASECELLVCALRSWHSLDEPRTAYHLRMVDWTRTSDAFVFRPVVDWDWKDTAVGAPPWGPAIATRDAHA